MLKYNEIIELFNWNYIHHKYYPDYPRYIFNYEILPNFISGLFNFKNKFLRKLHD